MIISQTTDQLAVDLARGLSFGFVLQNNATVQSPANVASVPEGQVFSVKVLQGAAFALAWGGGYVFAGGSAPTLGTTGGDTVLVFFAMRDGTPYEVARY